jgi:hypothetical protein
MNKKLKEILIFISLMIFLLVAMGIVYGWFSPAKPSVILHLAPNITEIKGFIYAKYPGSLACIACTGFYGEVRVYYNDTLICNAKDSLIGLGEANIPIRCADSLANYENETVRVEAIGKVTPSLGQTIESYDNKTLVLKIIRK